MKVITSFNMNEWGDVVCSLTSSPCMFGQADKLRFCSCLLLQSIASRDVWLTEVLYRFREIKFSRGARA